MVLEIIDFKFPRQYWAAGASYYGTDDQTSRFLASKQWVEGWGTMQDARNKTVLDRIQEGDILAMKSSATKGANHAITFTKLKAVGIVQKRENYYTFSVKWYRSQRFPIDFDGVRYSKTIEELRDDDLLRFVKDFILKIERVGSG